MESQAKDPQAAIEGNDFYMTNRRTLEFFLLAGLIGIGMPFATLMGVRSGDRAAAIIYAHSEEALLAPVDYKSMVMGAPGDEESGRTLFQTNCSACHGTMADGNGPASSALVPHPRNFQDPSAQWSHGRDPLDIYHTISRGSPGTAMVGFSAALSVRDRWSLVHYLSGLPGLKGHFKPMDEGVAASWRPDKEN